MYCCRFRVVRCSFAFVGCILAGLSVIFGKLFISWGFEVVGRRGCIQPTVGRIFRSSWRVVGSGRVRCWPSNCSEARHSGEIATRIARGVLGSDVTKPFRPRP